MARPPAEPRVGDFMTKVPTTVDPGLRLEDALDRMFQDQVRHLPVVDERQRLVGLLSTRDIAVVASTRGVGLDRLTVAQAMTAEPFTCPTETPLVEVAMQMERLRLGSAIVTQGGKPVGIFTTTDAMRALRCYLAGEMVAAEAEPNLGPGAPEEQSRETAGGRGRRHVSASGPSRNDGTLSWLMAHV